MAHIKKRKKRKRLAQFKCTTRWTFLGLDIRTLVGLLFSSCPMSCTEPTVSQEKPPGTCIRACSLLSSTCIYTVSHYYYYWKTGHIHVHVEVLGRCIVCTYRKKSLEYRRVDWCHNEEAVNVCSKCCSEGNTVTKWRKSSDINNLLVQWCYAECPKGGAYCQNIIPCTWTASASSCIIDLLDYVTRIENGITWMHGNNTLMLKHSMLLLSIFVGSSTESCTEERASEWRS